MRKNAKIITITTIIFAMILAIIGCRVVANDESVNTCVLYKIGDNSVTKKVSWDDIGEYVNDSYEWSIEPTTLMYTADGRTSWICNSEVEQYKKVCWSTYPPVTIYSSNGTRSVLVEEVDDYIATGIWFKTYKEANKAVFTYYPFQKSNLSRILFPL